MRAEGFSYLGRPLLSPRVKLIVVFDQNNIIFILFLNVFQVLVIKTPDPDWYRYSAKILDLDPVSKNPNLKHCDNSSGYYVFNNSLALLYTIYVVIFSTGRIPAATGPGRPTS